MPEQRRHRVDDEIDAAGRRREPLRIGNVEVKGFEPRVAKLADQRIDARPRGVGDADFFQRNDRAIGNEVADDAGAHQPGAAEDGDPHSPHSGMHLSAGRPLTRKTGKTASLNRASARRA